MKGTANKEIIERLQQQILKAQGHQRPGDEVASLGLGALERPFPGQVFARGAVHELISYSPEAAACTSGFLAVVLNLLMQPGSSCLWVSTLPRRSIYPPALKAFGIDPERILFVDAPRPKETLWTLEEALKCKGLTGVVGELTELSFADSRRLQLAVEQSQVTGFVHRFKPKGENAVACVSRWKISPVASVVPHDLPGVGLPRWQVELLKVRHGQPGRWLVEWNGQALNYIEPVAPVLPQPYELTA